MSQIPLPLEITCEEVQQCLNRGDDLALLDCRETSECQIVRIAGAQFLPMSELAARVGEIADLQNRRVAVYCHHGGRSLQVAAWLRQQGFLYAQSMAGGIDRWALAIEPGMSRY